MSRLKAILTWLVGVGMALTLVCMVGWSALLHHYNRPAAPVTREEAQHSVHAAIAWLQRNEGSVLREGNVPLWLMVRESARITHDPYLDELYRHFHRLYIERASMTPDRLMLDPDDHALLDFDALNDDPDYMQFIYYGLTCNPAFGAREAVQRGRDPHLCLPAAASTLLQPPCATHQLVGYMFMREHHCEDPHQVDAQIARLQDRIVSELHVDFRLLDPYVQRVLMLYWTHAGQRVDPVWLRRVLDAQQPDGGWADQQDITTASSGWWMGFGGYGHSWISLHRQPSNFHMTAQALFLMSLVQAQR